MQPACSAEVGEDLDLALLEERDHGSKKGIATLKWMCFRIGIFRIGIFRIRMSVELGGAAEDRVDGYEGRRWVRRCAGGIALIQVLGDALDLEL